MTWLLLLAACAPPEALDGALDARDPLEREHADGAELSALRAELPPTLVVKFADHARARLDGDRLWAEGRADLAPARRLLADAGVALVPVVDDPAGTRALLARAEAASGRAQPDLLGMYRVVGEDDVEALADLANALEALDAVEFAAVSVPTPPPADIAPTTSDYEALQGYLGPDPGIDAEAAWALGHDGAGVRVADCEYDFTETHEDLVDQGIVNEAGQTGIYYADHGTATLGEILSGDNGYGTTGIAHGASGAFYTEWSAESGSRRSTAIANACADSAPGDIVMLEMQAYGADGAYAPAEYDRAVWSVVKTCTDAGVVVIAAAGNGSANLDSSAYARYRLRGDSGAIIVGAGTPNTSHDREYFSTYGSRVNVQGWGSSVFTLGYGSYATVGGDTNQTYTSSFNGTSSATPVVTGAAALVQSAALAETGAPLTPAALRALLVSTGTPQGSASASTPIGPLPDVAAAIAALSGTVEVDGDGDGWTVSAGDCNDANPRVHPGVLRDRLGDGVDSDCDGTDV